MSYVAWNTEAREALVIDPKREDAEAYRSLARELSGYTWLAVIDTHTHADHVSCAADLAASLKAPLVMHQKSPSQRVDLRVARSTALAARAGAVRLLETPGHTQDSITVFWGPFLFGGDTILYGDTGRDDLPGGSAEAHFESLERVKEEASAEMILLPGHDHKGGRAGTWKEQLELNLSLKQSRADFVKEASAFDAPAPSLLKESLRENFR
jgi:glyoxylase-like metal-dependent hydrolase (beta-lactamase superfamily II)